jgi:hypothetical protein
MRRYLRNLVWRWLLGLTREHDEEIVAIVRMRLRHELLMEPDRRALLVILEARAGADPIRRSPPPASPDTL